MTNKLPPLPEFDGWIGANDLDPDAGVQGFSLATLQADRLAVWNAAIQRALLAAENTEAGDGSHDYNAGAETMSERIVSAIRLLEEMN